MIRSLLVLCWAYAALLVLLLVAVVAMTQGGTITLDFNRWHEGWLEVGLLATVALLMPAIMLKTIRGEYHAHARRGQAD